MNNEGMSEVIEVLRKKDHFLITAHVNPEGDSIGSQLAMFHLLKKLGKKAVMVNHDRVPDNLRFLPGSSQVLSELPMDFIPATAIILDCPVMERAGTVTEHLSDIEEIVSIDHHISNEYFGDVNWVDPGASSAGEMLYRLASEMGMEIDRDMAHAIYAAIVTDTGMFNYDNTSAETHSIAAELIRKGVSPKRMYSEIFEKRSAPQVKLLGKALSTMKFDEEGAVAYMVLTRQMFSEENVKSVSTDEFINYPRSVKGVKVAVFFKESVENPGAINVSFRSTGDDINVDEVASRFGGGGHKKASGCVLKGTLDEVKEKILTEIRRTIKGKAGIS